MEGGVEIALTRGLVAYVDAEDADLVLRHRWRASPAQSSLNLWYAMSRDKGRTIYMHRLILGAGDGQFVDHADSDGLNNRRSNIRLCTQAQNSMHRRPWAASGRKHVYRNGSYSDGAPRWRVFLDASLGRVEGGSFRCRDEASRRADELSAKHYGEFALLNESLAA